MSGLTFPILHAYHRSEFSSTELFEEALDMAIRVHDPWVLRKTYPDTRQWIVDVLDIDRATSSCAFAYKVELLGEPVVLSRPAAPNERHQP